MCELSELIRRLRLFFGFGDFGNGVSDAGAEEGGARMAPSSPVPERMEEAAESSY
jgi:hypothetical protein